MTAQRMNRVSVMAVLALAGPWLWGCAGGSSGVTGPTVSVRSEAGERASAKAVEGFVSATAGAYTRAMASQALSPLQSIGGMPPAGRMPAATAQGSCESVVIRYFSGTGQEQSSYDPATTVRLAAKGPCSTSQGIVALDATADDAQASSATLLVNGTAEGTYEGIHVRAVVTNVRMTKQFCGAPESGVLVATLDSLTATVRFDGSLNAKATYTWNGIGVSFTVAIPPCQ